MLDEIFDPLKIITIRKFYVKHLLNEKVFSLETKVSCIRLC